MADEIATQVGGASQAQATETTQVSVPSSPPPASAPPAASEGEPQWQSARDYLKSELGYDASHHKTDADAIRELHREAQAAREAQKFAYYGQLYLQHQDAINEMLAKRKAEQAQQPKKHWNPPEWNPSMTGQLRQNPQTGEIEGPVELVQKFKAYQAYRQEFAEKLFSNPGDALKPFIEEIAQEIAKKHVQESLGGYQAETFATQFMNANSEWLHARDASGNLQFNPQTGKPALSPLGERFALHVRSLQQNGMTDERVMAQIATQLVWADVARAQAGQSPQGDQGGVNGQAAAVGDEKRSNFLRNAAATGGNAIRRANQGAASGTATVNGVVEGGKRLSLSEQLKRNIDAVGGVK